MDLGEVRPVDTSRELAREALQPMRRRHATADRLSRFLEFEALHFPMVGPRLLDLEIERSATLARAARLEDSRDDARAMIAWTL
jgi:hypothetical protein